MSASLFGVFAQAVLGFVGNIILARMLGPDAFGMFTGVILLSQPFRFVSDLGLGTALLREKALDVDDIRRAFTALCIANAAIGLVWISSAGLLAAAMGDPRLAWPIRVCGLAFLVTPILTIATSLLGRDLKQGKVQQGSSLGYLIGYLGVGISLAWRGYGHWSLIWGFLAQQFITAIALWAYARPNLKLMRPIGLSALHRYGLSAIRTSLMDWVFLNIDRMLIQRLFGTQLLGIYAVSYNVVATPMNLVAGTTAQVLLPASARAQSDLRRIARAYLAAVDALCFLTVPVFVGVACISDVFIEVLYGLRWKQAGAVLPALALAMPFVALTYTSSAVIRAAGVIHLEFRIQIIVVTALALTIILIGSNSLPATAWGVLFIYCVRASLLVLLVRRTLGIGAAQMFASLRTGVVFGLAVAAFLPMALRVVRLQTLSPGASLFVCTTATAFFCLLVAIFACSRTFSPEFRAAAVEVLPVLPISLGKAIKKFLKLS